MNPTPSRQGEESRQGFTLIELLIVVAIIGILAAIAVPNFLNARIRATVARVRADCRGLGEAYTTYKLDNAQWPPHIDGDPAQHRFVTTPIAYYNTSVNDPFQHGLTTSDSVVRNTRNQYHMEPVGLPGTGLVLTWFQATRDRYPHFYAELQNSAYGVQSFGPSRNFEGNELYDSSNGIRSRGDLYTLVPGNFDPKKR